MPAKTYVRPTASAPPPTNPLLAPQVYNEETFSARGMQIINETKSLKQMLQRNVPATSREYFVSLTREDWKRA